MQSVVEKKQISKYTNCTWDPKGDKPLLNREDNGHGEAVLVVRKGRHVIQLCADCAQIPKFVRLAKYEPRHVILASVYHEMVEKELARG